jgi:collagenase-like PrtC family protease
MTKLELLSPARNLEYGKAAINCGADAVYIGAPMFGARSAVGNSVADIAKLAEYAHKFRAKLYVAMNTLLFDNEFVKALEIANQVWNAGVDALIIQDMGLVEAGLPPIPLFASTQTHNANWQKVLFLEKVGFQRVILARELSENEIFEIKQKTSIELESFVHGAICVCYSGQCYLSQALTGRSGNRGECSQPCRWDYNLFDNNKKTILQNKHVLSPKDLNLSMHLEALIDAGITSFKIEGRLKDISYVKNITAWYRQQLDHIMESKIGFVKSSTGKSYFNFIPDPSKTFNRGYTTYFINGRKPEIASFNTQKSLGKLVGTVKEISQKYFTLITNEILNNGDGLCYISDNQILNGFRVNKVEGNKIFPLEMQLLKIGTPLFRNHDQQFENTLSTQQTSRKIAVEMKLNETTNGIELEVIDCDGNISKQIVITEKLIADNPQKANDSIKQSLSKLGNTIFEVSEIHVNLGQQLFIPTSVLNELRRNVILQLEQERISKYSSAEKIIIANNYPYPETELNYLGNIVNQYSRRFFENHGVNIMESGLELQTNVEQKVLMTTRFCLRFEVGCCPNEKNHNANNWKNPFYIENSKAKLQLDFDCKLCVMHVKLAK